MPRESGPKASADYNPRAFPTPLARPVSRFVRFLLLPLIVLGLAAAAAWVGGRWWLAQPLPIPAQGFTFDVRPGASLRGVAHDLNTAGVLPYERALVALARWRGVDRNIKAGNYDVPPGTTLPRLLDRLTQGDVTMTAITVVEGTTFEDFRRALRDSPQVAKTVLDLPPAELMARLGEASPSTEGWFFPDTYFFSAGSSDLALLQRAHRLMRSRLDAAWAARSPDVPLKNVYEALTLASIVEKESGRAADRPLIASVFVNRLRLGMKLQTDPTVIYGIGASFDGNLRRRDLETDTPYNTYTREGLPPTPIALPGQSSIEAVLNPPKTDYLYFVSRGDGSSQFSTNLADHTRAVARYQKLPNRS